MGLPALIQQRPPLTPRGIVAALDIGSSKICCLIAQHDGAQTLEIHGIGHQEASGIKAGVIIDRAAAADAISRAVNSAEEAAGQTIEQVYINATSAQIHSEIRRASLALNGRESTVADIQRLYAEARGGVLPAGHSLLHALPLGFTLDQNGGIADPRGMSGQRLTLDLHMLSVPGGPLQSLLRTIADCHLDVARIVATPYASALACLVPDEMELGATLIDLGGGMTNVAVFSEGKLVLADAIPVGGRHITNDIARGLTTPLAAAERLKTLHGHTLVPTSADERELILVPQLGEDAPQYVNHAPRSSLIRIIRPRLEEIFEMVAARLGQNASGLAGQSVVLVGGGALIPGCRELAQTILQRQVRVGAPRALQGLGGLNNRGDFATAIGLLLAAVQQEAPFFPGLAQSGTVGDSFLGRIVNWFRQNV